MNNLLSRNLIKKTFPDLKKDLKVSPHVHRLFICTSGYESRSIYWLSSLNLESPHKSNYQFLVIGFKEHKNSFSRDNNDLYYRKYDLPITECSSQETTSFELLITNRISQFIADAGPDPVEIHLDYSSMPRNWYCTVPTSIQQVMRKGDHLFYWYSVGQYTESQYPTTGVDDFSIFSGNPSLSPPYRTHIFGLGFDRIRSQAIWSVLDPQCLICYYADSEIEPNYREKVANENRDILAASRYQFALPLSDFIFSYSQLNQIATQFLNIGDVVLVPDGPKPLILASSLTPLLLSSTHQQYGISCFHVRRRKKLSEISDVTASGNVFGFGFSY